MIVYLVRNLGNGIVNMATPFIETEKIFLDKEKAIKQYKEWSPKNTFGFGDAHIAEKVGSRGMSIAGDEVLTL
jgi:hypothetical protein